MMIERLQEEAFYADQQGRRKQAYAEYAAKEDLQQNSLRLRALWARWRQKVSLLSVV